MLKFVEIVSLFFVVLCSFILIFLSDRTEECSNVKKQSILSVFNR